MYRIIPIVFVSALLISGTAHAASIKSSVSAEADSGGNTVGSGGTVVTGNESASVETHTVVGGSEPATVHVEVEANGVRHEETYTSDTGNIEVHIATSSSAYGAKSDVLVDIVATGTARATSTSHGFFSWFASLWNRTATTSVDTEARVEAGGNNIFARIFARIFWFI